MARWLYGAAATNLTLGLGTRVDPVLTLGNTVSEVFFLRGIIPPKVVQQVIRDAPRD